MVIPFMAVFENGTLKLLEKKMTLKTKVNESMLR